MKFLCRTHNNGNERRNDNYTDSDKKESTGYQIYFCIRERTFLSLSHNEYADAKQHIGTTDADTFLKSQHFYMVAGVTNIINNGAKRCRI